MTLSAHQPAYLPWLGYFDKLIRSDIFVYLDSVQYERNSFINRNRIKTSRGEIWLTVPVKMKGHLKKTIAEMEIDNRQNWKTKHLNSIYLNYKKAPYFEKSYESLKGLYMKEFGLLSDLCYEHLLFWFEFLGIKKDVRKSSSLPVKDKKGDLVIGLCRYFKADHYISGALGKDYLDRESFGRLGIGIEFQDYRHPVYPQLWGDFLPYMSILDFCMNTNRYELITGGVWR